MASKVTLINLSKVDSTITNDLNTNFTRLADAIDDALDRTGASPNQLEDDVDANDFQIKNLGKPTLDNHALRLADITDDAKTAKATAVSVSDTGSHYTADNVEGVLEEQADVDTLSDLRALNTFDFANGFTKYLRGRSSVGDGGEGHFRWDSSDLSTEVGNDEVTAGEGDGGVYVAPTSDKTGASGAWVRQSATQNVDAEAWYGGEGPINATDGGTDSYTSDHAASITPADGAIIIRDFQSANTTTTPTLDGRTITHPDGHPLWSNAIRRVHTLLYSSSADEYRLINPRGTSVNVDNAPVWRDANGRAQFSDPSSAQDAATKSYVDSEITTNTNVNLRFVERLDRRTNRILNPAFDQGWSYWVYDGVTDSSLFQSPSGGPIPNFQLTALSTSSEQVLQTSGLFPVDPTKDYVLGVNVSDLTGSPDMNLLVVPFDENLNNLGALSDSYTSMTATGHRNFEVAAQGGASPAWPSGTVACYCAIQKPNSGGAEETISMSMAYFYPQEEIPWNYPATAVNQGFGTHEGLWDGNDLYVLATSVNELSKMNSGLVRQNSISVSDYPHDITDLNGTLWTISMDAAEVQEIQKSPFTVLNTYATFGSRQGFGITNDGTTLYAGVGNSSDAETPAIITINPADGTQADLSNDVDGGAANIPVEYIDGSVWSIHRTNSEVKRINPSTGATEATIAANIGNIYGLGAGSGYVFANGQLGVVQIDVSTNAVVKTYRFRLPGNRGLANVEVTDRFAFASGVVIDHQNQTSQEVMIDGGWKWCRSVGGDEVVAGGFAYPWLTVVGPG